MHFLGDKKRHETIYDFVKLELKKWNHKKLQKKYCTKKIGNGIVFCFFLLLLDIFFRQMLQVKSEITKIFGLKRESLT